jgi:hypothetical protein
MIRKYFSARLLPLLAMICTGPAMAQPEDEWRFRVMLDDREIGFHNFLLAEEDGVRNLTSEATFEVKLLFVKLFEYQHNNFETWQGDCLTSIESETDSNGEPFSVKGELRDGRFRVQGTEGTAELPACVMTFAYWNPDFLQQKRLLNSQNGAFLDVEVTEPEPDLLNVNGETRQAQRYRLKAGELDLLLWYSTQNNDWLALETDARGGRKLRYERL